MKTVILLAGLLALVGPPDLTSVPSARVTVGDSLSDDESLQNSCSLGCAIGWQVHASSAARDHPAKHLDDGSIQTAWVPSDVNRSPEVVFSFPKKLFGAIGHPIPFRGFEICPGFAGVVDLWHAYARPRTLLISHNGRPLAIAHLEDRRVDQSISVHPQDLNPGDTVSVKVLSVFPGKRSNTVAIAELVPQGAH